MMRRRIASLIGVCGIALSASVINISTAAADTPAGCSTNTYYQYPSHLWVWDANCWNHPGNQYRFSMTVSCGPGCFTNHTFDWMPMDAAPNGAGQQVLDFYGWEFR